MKDVSRKVYFARCIGPRGEPMGAYKIGCSFGHNDRIKAQTVSLPFSLELVAVTPGGRVMETACHMWLRDHRIGGEYFLDSPDVQAMVDRAAETGEAFSRIHDDGSDDHHSVTQDKIVGAFMAYHKVSLVDACAYAKVPVRRFQSSGAKKTLKLAAAAALIASNQGHNVSWPLDAFAGLEGRIAPECRPLTDWDTVPPGHGEDDLHRLAVRLDGAPAEAGSAA